MHFLQATENDEEDKIPSNHLYKSWNNTCSDYTKSSIEDLYCCQDLAEEHHIRYGVKCVVHGILAKDKEPYSHVDKDPRKAKELYQVIYE